MDKDASKSKGGRGKNNNWGPKETSILLDFCTANAAIIDGRFNSNGNSFVSKQRKESLWRIVSEKICSQCQIPREVQECKDKWKNSKKAGTERVKTWIKESKETGRGEMTSEKPSEEDFKIAETQPKAKLTGVPGGIDSDKPTTSATPSTPTTIDLSDLFSNETSPMRCDQVIEEPPMKFARMMKNRPINPPCVPKKAGPDTVDCCLREQLIKTQIKHLESEIELFDLQKQYIQIKIEERKKKDVVIEIPSWQQKADAKGGVVMDIQCWDRNVHDDPLGSAMQTSFIYEQ